MKHCLSFRDFKPEWNNALEETAINTSTIQKILDLRREKSKQLQFMDDNLTCLRLQRISIIEDLEILNNRLQKIEKNSGVFI